MGSFDAVHLYMLMTGHITQAQILALYPYENPATLTAAVNTHKKSKPVK